MTVILATTTAVLFGCGTYLLLQRQLTRIVIGLTLLAQGANLIVILAAGGRGRPPFIGAENESAFLDPLPQAFVLTAIVIAFGTTAFLLALAYRSWMLTHDDEVQDDVEDHLVMSRREREEPVDALAAAAAERGDELEDPGKRTSDAPTRPVQP